SAARHRLERSGLPAQRGDEGGAGAPAAALEEPRRGRAPAPVDPRPGGRAAGLRPAAHPEAQGDGGADGPGPVARVPRRAQEDAAGAREHGPPGARADAPTVEDAEPGDEEEPRPHDRSAEAAPRGREAPG